MEGRTEISTSAASLLTIALLIHVMIESIALGMMDERAEVYALLIGITSHKVFTSFSLGVSFSSSEKFNIV